LKNIFCTIKYGNQNGMGEKFVQRGCFLMIFLCIFQLQAQTIFCPSNINFEYGNFSGWYLYTGKCCPIIATEYTGPALGRHTLKSGVEYDEYGGFAVVDPEEGHYSLKLGNHASGAQAERACYYVRIPNDENDYSLVLRYAVVLENPNHTAENQPRFEVKGYDSATNKPLTCVQFSFVASSSIPGFMVSSRDPSVIYKDWTTSNINLSGMAGKTIALNFAAGDCGIGGHFGYGYIDLNCKLLKIESEACSGLTVSKLKGPAGFRYYDWYDSSFTQYLGRGNEISIPTPSNNTLFRVIVHPYPGFGCDDTLSSSIIVSNMSLEMNEDTAACPSEKVQLFSEAKTHIDYLPVSYLWSPHDGLSCYNCPHPEANPKRTTKYRLTVKDKTGCTLYDSMNFTMKLYTDSLPINEAICVGDEALFRTTGGGIGPFSYQWFKNGMMLTGETKAHFKTGKTQYIDSLDLYTVLIGNAHCAGIVSDPVGMKFFNQQLLNFADSQVICETDFIKVKGFKQYLWNTGSILDSIYITTGGLYSLQVTDANGCSSTDSTFLNMRKIPKVFAGSDTAICGDKTVFLHGTASYQDSVWWSSNNVGDFSFPDSLNSAFRIDALEIGTKELWLYAKNECKTVKDAIAVTFKYITVYSFEPEDTLVCSGSAPVKLLTLNTGGNFFGQYVTNEYFDPIASGLYSVYYQKTNEGCTDTSERKIRVVPMPESSFTYTPLDVSLDDTVYCVATSKNTKQYLWKIDAKENGLTKNLRYQFDKEGSHVITLVSINEMCENEFSQDIVVKGHRKVWVPNVFTPDGDGKNDKFKVVYGNMAGGVLKIYDRWGKELYNSNDLNQGWDGTFEGLPCQMDVYVFTVDYYTNENRADQIKGDVTLLR
jgi:gliding motility-associated-like protein